VGDVASPGSIANFMTDVAAMREYAGRFQVHSDVIDDESRRAWASAQNISGSGWTGDANTMSTMTVEEMMRAFRNIRDMMTWASQNLAHSADNYEHTELAGKQMLSS
jgi:WXG100 family type VII secretion target